MAQVTVYTADGRFSTTANDEAREGEAASELDRLLAGNISGREGYAGGVVGTRPTSSSSSSESVNDGRTYSAGASLASTLFSFRYSHN